MKPERLNVKAALLRWARESAGLDLDEAAHKIGLKRKTLRQWEELGGYPTARQLEQLGEKYHRPTAAFFLPEPPREPAIPTDFRRFPAHREHPIGPSTRLALRRARWLQRIFIELSRELESTRTRLTLATRLGDDASSAAQEVRNLIGVSVEVQSIWRTPGRALREWRHAVEARGVLVFQFRLEPEEKVRGFCLAGDVPVVALAKVESPAGRVFTLFHELGHILLARPGLCAPEEAEAKNGKSRGVDDAAKIERFCDAFSGSLLVPRETLLGRPEVIAYQRGKEELEAVVQKCTRTFAVSRVMLLRRMHDEGLVQPAVYWPLMSRWLRSNAPRRGGGVSTPPERVLSELGSTFVNRVLHGLDAGAVTYSDVAEYLALRLKHVDRLRELLPREASA